MQFNPFEIIIFVVVISIFVSNMHKFSYFYWNVRKRDKYDNRNKI